MSDSTSSSTDSSSGRPALVRSMSSSSGSSSSSSGSTTSLGDYGAHAVEAMLPANNAKRVIRPKPELRPAGDGADLALFAGGPRFPKTLLLIALVLSIIAVGVGLLLSFAGSDLYVEGVRAWRWGIVIAGVILSYFAALIVTAIVLHVLGGMSRVAHHFLNPMMMWIAALLWVLAVWALYRMVLGSNLLIRTANAIEGVLIAMIAVCLIYCGRVFIVSVFEMHVFRSVQPGVREGRVMDRFVHLLWAGAKPTKEAVAYIRQLTKISSTPFLGLMQVVGASHTISTLGLRSLAPTFPAKTSVDDEVRGVCGTLVDSLFEMCGNPPHINEAALTALVTDRSNAIGGMGARKTRYVFEVLDLEMSDKITPSIAREAFDDILSRRLTLIGDIRGHDLLVRILSDLLGFVVAIISIFLVLGAIGVDLLAMLVPVSALFFAFAFAFSGPIAEFVRGFIFVFFRRPYELEDWVTVDDGPELIVKSVSVLVTEFETLGGYAVSYSNSVLAGKKLGNMRRSTSVCQAQFYTIRAGLSQADIAAVKDTLREFFEASPKLYYPAATALISSLPHDAGMQLKIVYTVKCRWNQKGVYSEAGSLVHLRIVDIFKARGIEWGVNYKVQKLD